MVKATDAPPAKLSNGISTESVDPVDGTKEIVKSLTVVSDNSATGKRNC
jgi:hypothetical protein